MAATRGVVLFAHGSRDPLWRQPIERVAARIRERDAQVLVSCAYLELTEPDLATATAQLLAQGAHRVHVVPMFLGVGQHVRDDLPRLVAELKARHPHIELTLQPAIGEDARLIELMAQIALFQ
ncbi:MAG: CbiX/SirB N-terminal domain-containing protein [Rhodoferax sp.]|nr:CbiX/SirB N-terminal domain-containing protein [Rhodoferax sp.]